MTSGQAIALGAPDGGEPSQDTKSMTPEGLTPKQEQQWGDTKSMMVWKAPGFQHLFLKLLVNNKGDYGALMSRQVPVAATDGKNIILNPDTFFDSGDFGLPERTFVVAHEVVHNIFGDVELLHRCASSGKVPQHDGTMLPFDAESFQKSMDYRINALLVDSKIGKMPMKDGKPNGCYDLKIAGPNDSVLDVYKKLYKKKQENEDTGPGGFDKLLPPGNSTGQTPQQAAAQRNNQKWAVEVAAAQTLEQIRSQGKMAGSLQRMFKEIIQPEIPWTEHIKGIFARRLGSGSYNWRKPDRRFIVRDLYMPSRSGHGAGWICVWGDTSGSIGRGELETYMGELSGIIDDVRPRRLTVFWCDSRIHHEDEVEDAGDLMRIKARGVGGGGGTSCNPVFKRMQQMSYEPPDCFMGFTDGFVTFPDKQPPFPVIWASTTDQKYPWGEVVRINAKVMP